MKHILDQHSPHDSPTARRWAYMMQRKAMPAKATLALQKRKRTPKSPGRPVQFLRIERGHEA